MDSTKTEREDFYVKTHNWEKPCGGGEFTTIRMLHELHELFAIGLS